MTKLSIGFSPCPNDTFMFDAMINKAQDDQYQFDVSMADIEQLNQMAFDAKLDITKLSYHALTHLSETYQILNSGSALGNNCGPLLLSNKPIDLSDISKLKIAIPGEYTTAHMLLKLAFPQKLNTIEVLFSDIEDAILSNEVDLGLVIHENRFTYHERGLKLLMDLGVFWEEKTQLPIPLGAIVIKRSLPEQVKIDIDKILRKSIQHAFDYPKSAYGFIKDNAQAMDKKVMYQHIDLYVNDYSLDLGLKGKESVFQLFKLVKGDEKAKEIQKDLFVPKVI